MGDVTELAALSLLVKEARQQALQETLAAVEAQLDADAEEDYERGVNAGVMRASRAIRRLMAEEPQP